MMGERRIIPVTPNKRKSPALYELIAPKSRPETERPAAAPAAPSSPAAPAQPAARSPAPASASSNIPATRPAPVSVAPRELAADDPLDQDEKFLGLSPGSRLNIPIGFAFIGMAVVIAAVIVAYSLGYGTREKELKNDAAKTAANDARGIVDPIADPSPFDSGAPQTPGQPSNGVAKPAPRPEPAPVKEQPKTAAAKVYIVKGAKDDPRRPGTNYPVVARLPIKESTAAAEFLVSKGVPTAVVPSSDPRLFLVVPLTGLERGAFGTTARDATEKTLKDIGRAFKREQKGATDFFDLFWDKFER